MSEPALIRTRCCVVGGGPAGMMAGFLLARAGIEVVVLEKHADFFRDFRGDTIHPSTLELMHELGFLEEFLKLPHQEMSEIQLTFEGATFTTTDFSRLPVRCKFIAFMPQWDFLNFLAERARRCPSFRLMMGAEALDLVREGGRIAGVKARSAEGDFAVRADLVIAADGRSSILRERAGLEVMDANVPIDVLWTRIPKEQASPRQTLGYVENGRFMVLLDRGDYFQCGYIIRKGGFEAIRRAGLPEFRANIVGLAPFLRGAVDAISDWDEVKLLTVKIDRLRRWHLPGFLCIGDSAHAMSPAGGVGINLAVQDAVAAANLLAPAFERGTIDESLLRSIQRRRELPARLIQAMQIFVHRRMFPAVPRPARPSGRQGLPLPARVIWAFPFLRRIIGRMIGMGLRPEHIR